MTHPSDDLVDRVLHSLRDAEVPVNLEARIAVRIDARAASRANLSRPLFDVILNAVKDLRIPLGAASLCALASAALVAATFIAFHHRHPQTIAHSNHQPTVTNRTSPTQSFLTNYSETPRNFHNKPPKAAAYSTDVSNPTDPDTLALAETLAPSHPAPPMPVTQQERLLLFATRQGGAIELAELDILREPARQAAAEAREQANLRQYIQGLLAPLASAEALDSTPSSTDDVQSTPELSSPQQP